MQSLKRNKYSNYRYIFRIHPAVEHAKTTAQSRTAENPARKPVRRNGWPSLTTGTIFAALKIPAGSRSGESAILVTGGRSAQWKMRHTINNSKLP